MKLFERYKDSKYDLNNHLVMPPMCMFNCTTEDGIPSAFHVAHYGARAIGQVGMLIVEATGVQPNGRISDRCLGLWDDSQIDGHKQIVKAIQDNGSYAAIQLNHAGRKCETKDARHIGPSALEYNNLPLNYDEMTEEDIKETIRAFQRAAKRAHEAGYDGIEIHAAHGYLIHQFISPISNKRTDAYGQDRFLFLKEVVASIKEVWPAEKGLWMRISASDYHEDGLTVDDWIQFLNTEKDLVDFVHVSAGAIINVPIHAYPGYMLGFSKRIQQETNYKTIGVGLLNTVDMVSYALEDEQCTLVAIGRGLLRNPNLLLDFASARGEENTIPQFYKRAY